MKRNERHGRNNHHNWNSKGKNGQPPQAGQKKNATWVPDYKESRQKAAEREKAIRVFKSKKVICAKCGQPITDIASALPDKETGNPVHFDCALSELEKIEKPGENEKLTYIGQGRFAVLHFDNPHDMRHFTIRKVIQWEDKDSDCVWRSEISGLYSQIK